MSSVIWRISCLGDALCFPVEAGRHVAERGVCGLDQMDLRLGLLMGLVRLDPVEGQMAAGVGVGEDGADLADGRFVQIVDSDGAAHALVADVVGHDPAVATA
jgi:hypothetical protein